MNQQRQVRVGVYAACVRDGRILLVHQIGSGHAQGRWHLPGGGLEFGERPTDGVRREVREEVGCDVRVGPVVAVDDNVYVPSDGIERHGIRLIFSGETVGEPTSPNNDEIDKVGWFALGELPVGATVTSELAATLALRAASTTGPLT